ncbi:hypothetical protein BO70DRAFT_334971 [Aspergillus heteromorphus CBS 117.55]|uniref:Uncharacterized protein n=1 Tax=Aspergillus heteromorphus CBS 117.55 TaxID=1448321 RepID=A0A317WID2_9EURO|nr:uncharacterized protein BO70DRAFT_334971 [Aspergillus heteromorphus CBS 117.55]PWY84927.1 hypothetical protein BO70DRAFT_334971 [Aspergillus heteromorphus CBS 117.55]
MASLITGMEASKSVIQTFARPIFSSTAKIATEWIPKTSPVTSICAVVATIGGVMLTAPGAVSGAVLPCLGFGAGGVQAGSIAAAIHTFIGKVAGGSLFAVFQSAGAGGAGIWIVNAVVQVAGAVFGVGVGVVGWARGWFR